MKTRMQWVLGATAALMAGSALAQGFALEGAIIDSRDGKSLGVVTERGELASLFRAQKAMTFGILRSAGISLEQLSPEIRARIERFATTNVEAFRAFSQGLDLKDQGKFAEAREFFRRAAELDPNFTLAAEQQRSMPDVNVAAGVQTRAVLQAAAGAAVEKGKAAFVVDVARAVAAIQAGQTVVLVATPADQVANATAFTSNPAGSGTRFAANQVVSVSFGLAVTSEFKADQVRVSGGVLESATATNADQPDNQFLAQRFNGSSSGTGSVTLNDGSTAYWGSWNSTPTNSARITLGTQVLQAPQLGRVDYVVGDAPRSMPTNGTLSYSPVGGPSMTQVSGNIAVNFVTRDVVVQNLGFQLAGVTFSGLNGVATFRSDVASGSFSNNYTSGQCTGCTGTFNPLSSVFNGAFMGRDASGLAFSTFLVTGSTSLSGTHVFKGP
jgi:hypothetical protein